MLPDYTAKCKKHAHSVQSYCFEAFLFSSASSLLNWGLYDLRRGRQRKRHETTINNYWMRLSMLAIIIKAKVCVICRSRRLRRITHAKIELVTPMYNK